MLSPQRDLSFADDASVEMSVGNSLTWMQFQLLLKNKTHF